MMTTDIREQAREAVRIFEANPCPETMAPLLHFCRQDYVSVVTEFAGTESFPEYLYAVVRCAEAMAAMYQQEGRSDIVQACATVKQLIPILEEQVSREQEPDLREQGLRGPPTVLEAYARQLRKARKADRDDIIWALGRLQNAIPGWGY